MSVIVGSGDFRYRVIQNWARVPDGWSFKEVGAVGVDRNDRVYVFSRGEHPMMVFDRAGNFLRSWGEDIFSHAHGIHVAPDGTIYCTDDGDHTVRRLTPEGRVLTFLGAAPRYDSDPAAQIERIFALARDYDADIDIHLDVGDSTDHMDIHKVLELTEHYRRGGRE